MKKIMFNDKYGLTRAVLDGRKTMTRRIVPGKLQEHLNACGNPVLVVPLECIPKGMTIEEFAQAWNRDAGKLRVMPLGQDARIQVIDQRKELIKNAVRYKVGEVVAVAQSYKEIHETEAISPNEIFNRDYYEQTEGWTNKMFVLANLMYHHIRITDVRVERLHDISEEDCLREGVDEFVLRKGDGTRRTKYSFKGSDNNYLSPRDAFAALIDKVSGKGTWASNPWVFVYEFELVK